MTKYTLRSTELVYTPGIFAWVRNEYLFRKGWSIKFMRDTFGIKPSIAKQILDPDFKYVVDKDNETVTFTIGE